VPRALLRAGAALVARFDRVRGAESEYNPLSVDYLSRRGTYSIERARALVGYAPRVDLDEGMRRTERWLRAEGLL
jgi:nucleoside-diphosphate-sugar epimerase